MRIITKKVKKFSPIKNKIVEIYSSTEIAGLENGTSGTTIRVACVEVENYLKNKRKLIKYQKENIFFYDNINEGLLIEKFFKLPQECLICKCRFPTLESLSAHLQYGHKITAIDYTKQYICKNSSEWTCKQNGCNNETRYCTYKFKEYCKEHALIAMSIGGKEGMAYLLENYGIWNKGKTKYDDPRIMKQSLDMSGEGNPFFGKQHSKDLMEKIAEKNRLSSDEVIKRLEKQSEKYHMFYDISEYKRRDSFQVQTFCKTCNTESIKTAYEIDRGNLCKVCFPNGTSKIEREIGDWIEDFGFEVVRNSRRLLGNGKEVDIYIPEKNLGIEYDGLYWHCNRGQENFNKYSGYNKVIAAEHAGIDLLSIFSDEWESKKTVWQNIITSRLGMGVPLTNASFSEITDQPFIKEYIENHNILGVRDLSIEKSFSIINNSENVLVSVFHKGFKEWELTRLAANGSYNFNPDLLTGFFNFCLNQLRVKTFVFEHDLRFGTKQFYRDIKGLTKIKNIKKLNQWWTNVVVKWDIRDIEYIPNQMFDVFDCGKSKYRFNLIDKAFV